MGLLEKIKEIELEINRTQKNKATEYHIGQLKARLAKLRTQLLEPGGGGAAESAGFEVSKSGDARVSLIGFPSVGKSTLLTTLTGTKSEVRPASVVVVPYVLYLEICAGSVIRIHDADLHPWKHHAPRHKNTIARFTWYH